MSIIIRAHRKRPISRPGQVEKVLCKFGIGPERTFAYAAPEFCAVIEAQIKDSVPVGLVLTAEQAQAEAAMYRDITEWPENYVSTVHVEQAADRGEIDLEIWLEEDSRAPALIAELRACGFVVGLASEQC